MDLVLLSSLPGRDSKLLLHLLRRSGRVCLRLLLLIDLLGSHLGLLLGRRHVLLLLGRELLLGDELPVLIVHGSLLLRRLLLRSLELGSLRHHHVVGLLGRNLVGLLDVGLLMRSGLRGLLLREAGGIISH